MPALVLLLESEGNMIWGNIFHDQAIHDLQINTYIKLTVKKLIKEKLTLLDTAKEAMFCCDS